MKSVWKWILFGLAVFLLAFCVTLPLWGGFPTLAARSFLGHGMMRGGMMDWGMGGFGWIGLLFRLAVPVLVIAGAAALVYYLVKRPAAPPAPPALPTQPCANCGKPLDPAWVACPYCGKKQR